MSELKAWMEKLGAMSTEDIRDLMVAEGITGNANSSSGCPLANFLQKKLGVNDVGVGHDAVRDYRGIVPLPASARRFVSFFDNHFYPELEKKITVKDF